MMLSEAAQHMHGHLKGEDNDFSSVSIDTRNLNAGTLYLAIRGDKYDGHDFVEQALQKGALACVVEKYSAINEGHEPFVEVEDTRIALGLLASAWKKQYHPLCVAITGSSGKTTVKEMVASILVLAGQTLATKGNLNNDIGVPLTLLRLKETDKFAVIELGASAEGEIEYTSKLVCPDIALITNIAPAHIEGFGSIEGISRAKSEIFDGLVGDGTAIINLDEPFNTEWKDKLVNKTVFRVSSDFRDDADLWLDNISFQEEGNSVFQIKSRKSVLDIRLKLLGEHNAHNALLAAAVAKVCGVKDEYIVKGLENIKPVSGRLNPLRGINNLKIIDDTYNANPLSVKAALNLLSSCTGKTAVILGDMAELGENSPELHQEMGEWAAKKNIHQLVAIGKYAKYVAKGFGPQAVIYLNQDEAINQLHEIFEDGVTVLVKGSRSAQMENIVNILVNRELK